MMISMSIRIISHVSNHGKYVPKKLNELQNLDKFSYYLLLSCQSNLILKS